MDIDLETAPQKDIVFEEDKLKALQNENNAEYNGVHLADVATIVKEGKKYYK
jgi:hypothetical protein